LVVESCQNKTGAGTGQASEIASWRCTEAPLASMRLVTTAQRRCASRGTLRGNTRKL
jgi:hypothetical protein